MNFTDGINNAYEFITAVSGTLAGMGIIWGFMFRPVRKMVRRLGQFFDDWFGEEARPGVPRRPGMLERVSTLETGQAEMRRHVLPNGGSSLRDDVTGIKAQVSQMSSQIDSLHGDSMKGKG